MNNLKVAKLFLALIFSILFNIQLNAQMMFSESSMDINKPFSRKIDNLDFIRLNDKYVLGQGDQSIYLFLDDNTHGADLEKFVFMGGMPTEFVDENKDQNIDLTGLSNEVVTGGPYYELLIVRDFNKDGNKDLIVFQYPNNYVSWCRGDGSGNYRKPKVIGKLIGSQEFDFYLYDNSIYFSCSAGVGYFSIQESSDGKSLKYEHKWFEQVVLENIYDLDQDNNPDLILVDESNELLRVEISNDEGFSKKLVTDLNIKVEFLIGFEDVDGDGRLDLMSMADDQVEWTKQSEEGEFLETKLWFSADGHYDYDYDVADFDNDGKQDLIFFREDVKVAMNKGNGEYEILKVGSTDYDIMGFSAVDVDGDKDPDIVINTHGGIIWFENNEGAFSIENRISSCGYSDFFYLSDLDKDGDLDFFFKEECEDFLYWSERKENEFAQPEILRKISL